MARENIHKSLEVYYEKVDSCPLREQQFNFFEFAYVLSGKGMHGINGHQLPFKAGDLFLITPHDHHSFDLNKVCEFMVIRFATSYVEKSLLHYASHAPGSILKNEADKRMVRSLMQHLQHTVEQQTIYGEDLMRHLVNAIIVIAARNISVIQPAAVSPNTDTRILQIIDYIQENIYQPELLKISVMAEQFGLSDTYLGSYFRKQCNESIQQYISSYRIRLIEHRLRFSDKRVHEIADEFGFADESHINKFFKRHKGLSIRVYRDSSKRDSREAS